MVKGTNSEVFQEKWENWLKTASKPEIEALVSQTSPQHPNDNMCWLYDRLVMALVEFDIVEMNRK